MTNEWVELVLKNLDFQNYNMLIIMLIPKLLHFNFFFYQQRIN